MTKKKVLVITDDVMQFLETILKPSPVSIESSKAEFISNHVKEEALDKIKRAYDAGHY